MKSYYFTYGRTALKYGLLYLGLKAKDIILIPSYICDVVLQPLKQLNIGYEFYNINEDFSADWSDVEQKIKNNVKALIMVNYFGQAQEIEKYIAFCNRNNLFLIEDNAHGYGGVYNGKLLGTFGDIGISSPRKNINVLFGGVLYIKGNKEVNVISLKKDRTVYYRKIVKSILIRNSKFRSYLSRPPITMVSEMKEEKHVDDFLLNNRMRRKIVKTDIDVIREQRIDLYYIWDLFVKVNKLKPIFNKLEPNVVPLCYPVLSRDKKERDKWLQWGYDNNIRIHTWPNLPFEVLNNSDYEQNLWERLLCFPIDNEIKSKRLLNRIKL